MHEQDSPHNVFFTGICMRAQIQQAMASEKSTQKSIYGQEYQMQLWFVNGKWHDT
jgi:hypothetical protein